MIDRLFSGAVVVTVNKKREVFFDGALAIKDGRIVEVGPSAELKAKYQDCALHTEMDGKILFPGFVNTHCHLFQTLLKGLGDDMVLKDWLRTMTFPAASNLTSEDCYQAALLGCMEGLHSGMTTNLDYMYPHPKPELSDAVIGAFDKLGMRGILARGCLDTGVQFGAHEGILQKAKDVEEDVYRLFDRYHNSSEGRVKIWVAPTIFWTNTKELACSLWRITNEYKSGYTIHISETPFDRTASQELHGKPDAELLEEWGILGPNVLMVHCCYLTDKDIALAKEYDLKVSHNVCSNQYLSSGVADVPKMLENGITVSLGVDGAASNNSQDMLELMKFTALQHKVATRNPVAMSAEKVLEMATIDGARAVGLEDEIGSLEAGKKADIVVFDPLKCPKAIPMHNPVSTLVYSSSVQNIQEVLVDGRTLLKDGVITMVESEEAEYKKAQKCAEALCERGGITNRKEGHAWNNPYAAYERK